MVTVTDEMVETAILGFIHNQPDPGDVKAALISDMRAALTAAFALVTPGAGFRAGAEWAAGIIERGQQTFGNSTRSLTPRVDGNMDGLAYADAIRAVLAAMPETYGVRRVDDATVAAALGEAFDAGKLAALPEGGDGPKRWRHVKRGSTYVEVARGELQVSTLPIACEGSRLVAYRCETDGRVWFRREAEFEDGRFEPLPSQGTSP